MVFQTPDARVPLAVPPLLDLSNILPSPRRLRQVTELPLLPLHPPVPAASDGKQLVSEERIKSPRRESSTTAPSARRKSKLASLNE